MTLNYNKMGVAKHFLLNYVQRPVRRRKGKRSYSEILGQVSAIAIRHEQSKGDGPGQKALDA